MYICICKTSINNGFGTFCLKITVATKGATGVSKNVTGTKLTVCRDHWQCPPCTHTHNTMLHNTPS